MCSNKFPVIQRTLLYSRRIHILAAFYVAPYLTEKHNKLCVCREQYWKLWNVRKRRDLEITLSDWLSKGLGACCTHSGALETGIISETGERSFSVGQLWGAGKWTGRAGFKGVCPAASQGPMLWNSQHHHLRILKSWIRTPLCTRPCKLYMWDCVQALERGRFGFKF